MTAIVGLAATVALAACGGVNRGVVTLPAPPSAASGGSRASAPLDGTLTLLDGATARLSAFRGQQLLDPRGEIVYRGAVPVSTMGALLAHLQRAGVLSRTSRTSSSPSPPAASPTLP